MNKQNKGITLVALVITIIVLIILAAVSINAVMNDGLIKNAKEASEKYETAQVNEEVTLGKLLQDIENQKGNWVQAADGTITNKNDSTKTFTVGDPVDYVAKDATLQWRVLGVNEDGRLELIATTAKSINFDDVTEENLNDLIYRNCTALYGNESKGTAGRVLNINDFEKDLSTFYEFFRTGLASYALGDLIIKENIEHNAMDGIPGVDWPDGTYDVISWDFIVPANGSDANNSDVIPGGGTNSMDYMNMPQKGINKNTNEVLLNNAWWKFIPVVTLGAEEADALEKNT